MCETSGGISSGFRNFLWFWVSLWFWKHLTWTHNSSSFVTKSWQKQSQTFQNKTNKLESLRELLFCTVAFQVLYKHAVPPSLSLAVIWMSISCPVRQDRFVRDFLVSGVERSPEPTITMETGWGQGAKEARSCFAMQRNAIKVKTKITTHIEGV